MVITGRFIRKEQVYTNPKSGAQSVSLVEVGAGGEELGGLDIRSSSQNLSGIPENKAVSLSLTVTGTPFQRAEVSKRTGNSYIKTTHNLEVTAIKAA